MPRPLKASQRREDHLHRWLQWVYTGTAQQRRQAVRMLAEQPWLHQEPWVACATGEMGVLQAALRRDPTCANRAGGPLGMPPLVAVTHSLLALEDGFAPKLLAAAGLLLTHGADANSRWVQPDGGAWSALYGAAGRTHNAALTRLLLVAGADPNDGESLYHSLEAEGACTELLLDAGARVTGTNAIGRALDYGNLGTLRRMLQEPGAAAEKPWLHHAVRRGRSLEFLEALRAAGSRLDAGNRAGESLYRFAQRQGRAEVVAWLEEAGLREELAPVERFVAACARGDTAAAQAMLAAAPGMIGHLDARQRQALPEAADVSNLAGVRVMLATGWPLEEQAAWGASALHLAVYRGDAAVAELLLAHGADWRAKNSFGGDVPATLEHAAQQPAEDPLAPREYAACARVLIEHGAPMVFDTRSSHE